ncbi:polysaccharide deacetylase family protein [Piscinibacter sakaiensis]|uniref:Polysaccharide deacetylase n=1 Tax=Piscinibacter sakaiensis TaxID=1547922 RepID=A0A0K8P531_PISS1|nr:polysaccharide deacetylase family protein [Piscinibacter sakaiensis]GAP37634.1 polysaccharide deacetylase [Piscinibacter sakaiensis]
MRDLRGYGPNPPAVRWPDGRRLAVSFVVNFEEGAEFSVRDGDARNEAVYEVIDRQDGPDPCIDSHFEFGTRTGWWRLAELFEAHGAPFTLSACGRAVERSPWLARDAVRRGHEVSGHGWRWQTAAGLGLEEERTVIRRTAEAIEAATGRWPVGWHTRSVATAHTRRLLVEQGFLYDSDAYNDDTPYQVDVDGRRHLVLPYAFDTNDMQFQHTQRFATGREFAAYVCDAADWLLREGERWPRMLSIGLHLRMVGRAGRIGAVDAILRHLAERGDAWIATREQIARHWLAHAG